MSAAALHDFTLALSDGRQLVAQAPADLAEQAQGLLDTLARLDAKGPHLRDGSTIQFGCSRLTIRQSGPTPILHVHEPDYLDDPEHKTVAHVSRTLRVLYELSAMAQLANETPCEVRLTQTFVCERGALRERDIYFERQEPTGAHDSGWFAGRAVTNMNEPNPPLEAKDLVALPLYQLFIDFPAALKLLALPLGYLAVFRWDTLVALSRPDNSDVPLPTAPVESDPEGQG